MRWGVRKELNALREQYESPEIDLAETLSIEIDKRKVLRARLPLASLTCPDIQNITEKTQITNEPAHKECRNSGIQPMNTSVLNIESPQSDYEISC